MKTAIMKRWKWFIIILSVFVLIPAASFCEAQSKKETAVAPVEIAGAEYAGMDTCATCHEKEFETFSKSIHGRIGMEKERACENESLVLLMKDDVSEKL